MMATTAAAARTILTGSFQAGPADLTVELRRALDLSERDAASLDALIDSRPAVGVFLSRAWLAGYFADPPDAAEPWLALVREGTTLRGVVPVAIRRERLRVRVGLLGGGAGSDRVDLLAARGFEAAAADAFLRCLRREFGRRGFTLEFRDVPGDSPLWGAVHRASSEQTSSLTLTPREIHPLPYLNLTEVSPDGVGASDPLNPHSLAKHRRWLERRGPLAVEVIHHVDEALEALETLVMFLRVRWADHEHGSALDDSRLLRFHRRAVPLLLAERRLRMIRLSSSGQPIAVFYGIASGGWWGYYLSGYDREWAARIRLGQIVLATAIDLAAREGSLEFDFLKGAEPVKYLWRVRERTTVDADIYPDACGPQLARAITSMRDAAAAFAKSARRIVPIS
jgi:CelD/BcsL family acetyltransferase involved in cellulose biosynthesis